MCGGPAIDVPTSSKVVADGGCACACLVPCDLSLLFTVHALLSTAHALCVALFFGLSVLPRLVSSYGV